MPNFVPEFILKQHSHGVTSGQFDAASLFIDISGFSAVTHTLSQHGSEAAEGMAAIMSAIFEPLVDAVYAHGGLITGFAGDGFTALFPTDQPDALPHALAAARAIQAHLAAHPVHETAYGRFPFAVKLGLAQGAVHWGILAPESPGDGALSAYYFSGPAIDAAAGAEHHAQPGTLILTPDVQAALGDAVQGLPAGDQGHVRLLGLSSDHAMPAPAALPPVEIWPGQEHFIPAAILDQTVPGEFRQVVTIFINLMGVQTHADLAPFIQAVFALQRDYGGTLARVDFGDKGCNLLLFWGVPTGSEADVDRALAFTLALGEHTPGSYKAGMTHATMFAGLAGSARRGEWTCYGDGINLAARLMIAAPWGSLWLDAPLARRAGAQFVTEPVGERVFKGFDAPLAVHALVERQRPELGGFFRGRMVGHAEDLARLAAFVAPLLATDGERRSPGSRSPVILSVEGEAGLGKSRLVTEFLLEATTPTGGEQPRLQWALLQTDATVRAPFNPWRYWLRTYFQQSPGASAARNKRAFGRVLDGLIATTDDDELQADLNRGRAFLGALLDLYWDASPYDAAPPEGRYELTLTALTALVQAESRRCPLVLNLEDAQWLDADSVAVVTRLMRVAAEEPFAILATARPVVGDAPLFGELPYARLALGALSRDELAELAREVLGGPVDEQVSALLEARAEGNPFFAEQILLFLREQGGLVADGEEWRLAEGAQDAACLPSDVRLIFTSRLDALSREVREVVQTAAVLGREFEVRVLAHMLRQDAGCPAEQLPDRLREAEQDAVWTALTEIHYLFRHALLRDAAYEMQLRARRRELHKLAAEALETLYATELDAHAAEIAYHYQAAYKQGLAEVRLQAVDYLTRAGQGAAAGFENAAALQAFGDALALLSPEEDARRWDLLLAREAVDHLTGDREAQQADLAALENLAEAGQRPADRALAALRRARYAEAVAEYPLSIEQARAAAELARAAGRVTLEAQAQQVWCDALWQQGDYPAANEHGQQALVLARAVGPEEKEAGQATAAKTLLELGNIMNFQGDNAAARAYYEQSLALCREIGDRVGEGRCVGNLGIIFYCQDDLAAARECYEQGITIKRATGDRRGEGITTGNLGILFRVQGNLPGARRCYDQALAVDRAVGDRSSEANVLGNLSSLALTQGDLLAARDYLEQGLSLARDIGDQRWESYALSDSGALYHCLGYLDAAIDALEQSLVLSRAVGTPGAEARALLLIAEVRVSQGQLDLACDLASQAAAHVDQAGDLEDKSLSHTLRGQIALLEGEPDAAHEYFAAALNLAEQAGNGAWRAEALAGLAQAALGSGNLSAAREHLAQAMSLLADNPALHGLWRPFRALLWIGQGWLALDEPVGVQVIADAHALLQARAATVPDDAARRMFLENVPEHRDLVALYAALTQETSPVPPETGDAAAPTLSEAQEAPVSPAPEAVVMPPVEPLPAPTPPVVPLTAATPTVVDQAASPDAQTLHGPTSDLAAQIVALLSQLVQATSQTAGLTVNFHGDIHIHQIVIHGQPKPEPDA